MKIIKRAILAASVFLLLGGLTFGIAGHRMKQNDKYTQAECIDMARQTLTNKFGGSDSLFC